MEAFFPSLLVVALAEMGDKTQLLAIVLAARFRQPLPIIAGMLVATAANHVLAALIGTLAANFVQGRWFQGAIALSFIAMGLWTLIPDKLDGETKVPRYGPFLATVVAFFLIKTGDKTQFATIALGARFHNVLWVALGTTTGMMLVDVPAIYLSDKMMTLAPIRIVHRIAAALFLVIGLWTLWEVFG